MDVQTFINSVATGNAAEAKETLNDLLSARAFEALESKKIETYKYCILDDDTDFYKFQKPFFVHVNSFVGITDENVQKAIKILNS